MSATAEKSASANSATNPGGIPAASPAESVRVVALGLLPNLIRGLFSPRPAAMKLLTRARSDERMVDALANLRRKHPGQGLRLFGGRLVVLWGTDAIREVLDQSADTYASDAGAKAKGMCHFQPDALTLSRGEDWRDRRAFNESVLATSERLHPQAERFLRVVDDEVTRLRVGPDMVWSDWERMFDRLTLRLIFGDRCRDAQDVTDRLEKLMGQANRLAGLSEGDDYYELYGAIERHLADPEPDSLLARVAEAPQTDRTRVAHQVPHWIFATRDTLGANAYRALALVVHDPAVLAKVRAEVEGADLTDPEAVDGMTYLGGCFQEAMRLWPTVPLLARESTRETVLAGEELDEGAQVMILNTFNHRDPDVPGLDRVIPERWEDGGGDYRFNHLSNGSQDCPGGSMVLFLGKATLARMLREYELELREPKLPAGGDLPKMLDFFSIRFQAKARADA